MKKSIFNVALLSMLFVLGACSVKDEGGSKNPAIDSLPDVGETTGYTKYLFTASDNIPAADGGGTSSIAEQYFFNDTTKAYKYANASTTAGNSNPEANGTYTRTEEGTYTPVTVKVGEVKLSVRDESGVETVTPITDLKEFTSVYTITTTKEDGELVNPSRTQTYLVKKDGSLQMIRANDNQDGTYTVEGRKGETDTFEKLIANTQTYAKQ